MVAFDTVTEAKGFASTATTYDTITKATGFAVVAVPFTVSLGADVSGVEPYSFVQLHATVTGDGGLANVTLQQTGGVTASVFGAAPDWTYQAPGALPEDGAHLIFTVTAELAGVTVSADVDHFVYPNTFGYYTTAGQLVAAQVANTVDSPLSAAPFPDAGLFPDNGVLLRS